MPFLAGIQAKTHRGIESVRSSLLSEIDHVIIFAIGQLVRHIVENLFKKVAQYVNEFCLVDKWHWGDFIV